MKYFPFKIFFFISLFFCFVFADADVKYSNVFLINIQEKGVAVNDRLGADIYTENEIGRTVINLNLESLTSPSHTKIGELFFYRFNQEIILTNDSLILGLQEFPLGVCRIWNPVDKFNPVYALSIEPEQIQGVFGINYAHAFNDLSYLQILGNMKDNNQSGKVAIRWSGLMFDTGFGITGLVGEDISMLGIDQQVSDLDNGMEFRSEVAYTDDRVINKRYWNFCYGVEYGVLEKLTFLAEYYYNGANHTSNSSGIWNSCENYFGITAKVALGEKINISCTEILNMDDSSIVMNIILGNKLSDELDYELGTSFGLGDSTTEFGSQQKSVFFKLSNVL